MSPEAFNAYAVKAAVEMLEDRPPDQWFAKITAVNPTYPQGHALAGRIMVLNRRYHEGIAMYRNLLSISQDVDIRLEEYAREMIRTEEDHVAEIEKMLRRPGMLEPAT